jgi:hypothetical protein
MQGITSFQMKIFSIFYGLFDRLPRACAVEPGPLDHPEIKRMSLRELADLPLHPFCQVGAAQCAPAQRRSENWQSLSFRK